MGPCQSPVYRLRPGFRVTKLIAQIEETMANIHGFRRFADFNPFLVKTYKARKKGQTVADLYPVIIG